MDRSNAVEISRMCITGCSLSGTGENLAGTAVAVDRRRGEKQGMRTDADYRSPPRDDAGVPVTWRSLTVVDREADVTDRSVVRRRVTLHARHTFTTGTGNSGSSSSSSGNGSGSGSDYLYVYTLSYYSNSSSSNNSCAAAPPIV